MRFPRGQSIPRTQGDCPGSPPVENPRKLSDFGRDCRGLGVDIGKTDPIPFETSGHRALQDCLHRDRAWVQGAGAYFYDLNVPLSTIE